MKQPLQHNRAICKGDRGFDITDAKADIARKLAGMDSGKVEWLAKHSTSALWRECASEHIAEKLLTKRKS